MLAPIALYPDDLLMQMLMAATYPLEIVQAKRWLGQGQNAALRGDALTQALAAQPWDPSVKSLLPFPDVLAMMNDQLDWTQQVGDAVLAQRQDVMNAIQVLRGRAQAAGMLQSGPQQTVNVTQTVNVPPPAPGAAAPMVVAPPQVITIAPAQPDTVYVPAYNPNVVYGAWPYPASPPVYYPPPVGWGLGNALLTGMAFAGGGCGRRFAVGLGQPELRRRQHQRQRQPLQRHQRQPEPDQREQLVARYVAPARRRLWQRPRAEQRRRQSARHWRRGSRAGAGPDARPGEPGTARWRDWRRRWLGDRRR